MNKGIQLFSNTAHVEHPAIRGVALRLERVEELGPETQLMAICLVNNHSSFEGQLRKY